MVETYVKSTLDTGWGDVSDNGITSSKIRQSWVRSKLPGSEIDPACNTRPSDCSITGPVSRQSGDVMFTTTAGVESEK